jgi:hypothetical protein
VVVWFPDEASEVLRVYMREREVRERERERGEENGGRRGMRETVESNRDCGGKLSKKQGGSYREI